MTEQAMNAGGWKIGGKGSFAAAIAIAVLIFMSVLASGADFEMAYSEGIWTDADIYVSGIGTNEIRWGTSTGFGQSGFDFDGNTGASFNSGATFLIGTFTHHNKPIYGDAPTEVELEITLHFNNPSVSPDPTFTYTLGFDETANDPDDHPGDVCPYGGDYNGCYDRVTFPSGTTDTFWVGDTKYTLEVLGFTNSPTGGTPVSYFDTKERQDNVAYIVGRLTIVCTSPSVLDQPDNVTVYVTEDAEFSVTAAGSDVTYQWYKDGVALSDGGNISGATTATLTITEVDDTDAGEYTVRLTNNCDTVDSNAALLTVLEPDCLNYDITYVGRTYDGTNTTFTYTVTSYQPPAASHWILGVASCITETDIVTAGPGTWVFGYDPTTEIYGIKFDTMVPEGSSMTFSVTLSGYWAEGTSAVETEIKAATKAAQKVCVFPTTGPSCRRADLELTKDVDDSTPVMGSDVTYTITLTNNGPTDATGVTVTDLLPSGVAFVSSLPSQGSYNDVSGVWSVGTLNASATATLRLTATVLGTGNYENTAEVTTSDVPDPDSTPNNHVPTEDDQDSSTIVPSANPVLLVEKSGPATANVGDSLDYTVTVQHDPTSDGAPVYITSITDSLGIPLSLSSGDDGDGWLESSEVWVYTGSRVVLATDPTSLVNEACVSGEDYEGDPVSDCDSTTTTIEHNPAILTVKTASQDVAIVGETVDYTITVQHHTSSDGTPVDITDVTDSLGIALSGPSGDDGDGWLEAGETWTYTGSREVTSADLGDLVNTACVYATDVDGDPLSDCDSTTVTVVSGSVALTPASAVNQVGSAHTLELTATAEGAVPDTWHLVSHDVTPTPASDAVSGPTVAPDGLSATWLITINSTVPEAYAIDATVQMDFGLTSLVVSTDGTGGSSGPASKEYVDVRLVLDPSSATNQIGDDHVFTATLEVTANGSDWIPLSGKTVAFAITSGPGSLSSSSAITDGNGEATVTLSSSVVGSTAVSASFNGTAVGASATASDVATKDWIDVRLSLDPSSATNQIGDDHVFTATLEVTTNGSDWLPLSGKTVAFAITSGPGSLSSSSAITDSNGEATVTLSSSVVGSTAVSASFNGTAVGASATASGAATKDWIDVRLSLDPSSATNQIGNDHVFTATLEVTTDGSNWIPLTGKTINFVLTSGVGSPVSYTHLRAHET